MDRPCNILVVDDDAKEVELIRSALDTLKRKSTLEAARNVAEAKEFMSQRISAADKALPDLVLIDLGLGESSGHEFIRWCKSQPMLGRLRLVVFTGSKTAKDKAEALKTGVSAYEAKPVDFQELIITLSRLLSEWCE